jgi:hypothetical protein
MKKNTAEIAPPYNGLSLMRRFFKVNESVINRIMAIENPNPAVI